MIYSFKIKEDFILDLQNNTSYQETESVLNFFYELLSNRENLFYNIVYCKGVFVFNKIYIKSYLITTQFTRNII